MAVPQLCFFHSSSPDTTPYPIDRPDHPYCTTFPSMPGIDTNTDGNRTFFLTIDFKAAFSDPLPYCLRHFHRFIPIPPEQADKKIPPRQKRNSRHIIILTASPDNLRDLFQTDIACNMTIPVVKLLKNNRYPASYTKIVPDSSSSFLNFLPDKPLHIPPVIHIRQLINHGLMAQNLIYPGKSPHTVFGSSPPRFVTNHFIPVNANEEDSRKQNNPAIEKN